MDRAEFEIWYDDQPDGRMSPWDVWKAATELERKECAETCDKMVYALDFAGRPYKRPADAERCANAIRKRG